MKNKKSIHPLSRYGTLCLVPALLMLTIIPNQSNTVHFIGGLFLGMSLVLMLRGLYLTRRGGGCPASTEL